MTDRELLELAAKAAGLDGIYDADYDMFVLPDSAVVPTMWNPLKDDSDALRLAVKLGIRLEFADGWVVANAGSVCAPQFSERTGSDAGAATRRAIVRAAAEIGKAMQQEHRRTTP